MYFSFAQPLKRNAACMNSDEDRTRIGNTGLFQIKNEEVKPISICHCEFSAKYQNIDGGGVGKVAASKAPSNPL